MAVFAEGSWQLCLPVVALSMQSSPTSLFWSSGSCCDCDQGVLRVRSGCWHLCLCLVPTAHPAQLSAPHCWSLWSALGMFSTARICLYEWGTQNWTHTLVCISLCMCWVPLHLICVCTPCLAPAVTGRGGHILGRLLSNVLMCTY